MIKKIIHCNNRACRASLRVDIDAMYCYNCFSKNDNREKERLINEVLRHHITTLRKQLVDLELTLSQTTDN